MTIQIPDDLARGLQDIAALRNISVEQLAIERLQASFDRSAAPRTVLTAIQALRHPSPSAVDDLEAAIAAGRLPVNGQGVFDR
jgi:hypothetical protein